MSRDSTTFVPNRRIIETMYGPIVQPTLCRIFLGELSMKVRSLAAAHL
jgi:hypothetical protein